MLKLFYTLFFICLLSNANAQPIDVQHYNYAISLSDKTDKIEVDAIVAVKFLQTAQYFYLDLIQQKNDGKGMKVHSVQSPNVASYEHKNNRVLIYLKQPVLVGGIDTFYIRYSGIPEDGLIISRNKYGEKTFFADNWPNRARHWMISNDTPDDKATVEFHVAVPDQYKVVSNGILQSNTPENLWIKTAKEKGKHFHWKQTIPIPTKVMVIGAANFAVKHYENSPDSIPVSAWVYANDSTKGFHDYALAVPIMNFFSNYIAPYPFNKLANVQSTTIFGGMENASAIFYAENSVTGDRTSEALIAHEIAHQWFGNMATEKHFSHLWLSEGFATYLTHMYIEHKYGQDSFRKRLMQDKEAIIRFAKTSNKPVVDSTAEFMDLLNANSYQKGGWVLHMLRVRVGDTTFRKILQEYYKQYKGGNADSKDFEKVAEAVSGQELRWFFDQWLKRSGIPELAIKTKIVGDEFHFMFQQTKDVYQLPMRVTIIDDGTVQTSVFFITQKENLYTIKLKNPNNAKVSLDFESDVLFQYKK